jgi:hypothetical protein
MDSSGLFSHPIVHEAVRKSDTATDPVTSPVFSDAEHSSEPRQS